jgi:hypothetical protein
MKADGDGSWNMPISKAETGVFPQFDQLIQSRCGNFDAELDITGVWLEIANLPWHDPDGSTCGQLGTIALVICCQL